MGGGLKVAAHRLFPAFPPSINGQDQLSSCLLKVKDHPLSFAHRGALALAFGGRHYRFVPVVARLPV